ncbi:pentatricopeptide repeat-containing protein [Pyrus ussuriensis x Pyrus communis]|uniref:Pentatricopeptide repeat-containing protein n=1 Tax=Pyrus ussuriensis x Pyrus communis TaxID=2448454 RepID=A0A5N5HUK1_9ROSA|nr:pentatricopeptide repeat-containing protein [Pyrus ussuriensis x Pyrus communis]
MCSQKIKCLFGVKGTLFLYFECTWTVLSIRGIKRVDEAVDVYHGILLSFPGQEAYIHTVVMDGLMKVGKFNAAIRVFRKAVAEGFTLNVVVYTVAIIGLFMGGRAGEAWSLFRQMKDVGLAPTVHTYNVIVSGFVKVRDLNMVNLMLQEMI